MSIYLLQFSSTCWLNVHLKIINGDCSDNIPSIFPKDEKISNKRRKLIRENRDELIQYLAENKTVEDQYEFNKKMICFTPLKI